jgi:hypothetical protein
MNWLAMVVRRHVFVPDGGRGAVAPPLPALALEFGLVVVAPSSAPSTRLMPIWS